MIQFAGLLEAHGIKAAFVMAGSIVNQDTSLGYVVYTTPGTEDVSSRVSLHNGLIPIWPL